MLLIIDTITWKPHTETAIEIALRERDAGREVLFCQMRHGLPACEDQRRVHALLDLPGIRHRRARELLHRQQVPLVDARFDAATRRSALAQAARLLDGVTDCEALRRVSVPGFHDLGWAVLSSAASMTLDSGVSPRTHPALLRRLCASALMVFQRCRELIEAHAPGRLLLFNGRFASTRAVARAAEHCGLPWSMHERGRDWHHYWVDDCMPQDIDRLQEKMRAHWDPGLAQAGHNFFEARRDRVERAWHSFAKDQTRGRLPAEMQAPGDWVTFFTSSEDEMFAIGDRFVDPAFPDQQAALQAALAATAQIEGLRLCVRVHPHIARKSAADRRKWRNLQLPGALVLGPEDPTDSYALIDRSRAVMSFGSTIGVEASYWGRPSLLFGRSFYDQLDACTRATDLGQVAGFLAAPVLTPRERTLAYGAFWELLGQPYRHYRSDNFHRGSICGIYLDDVWAMRLARRLLRWRRH